MVIFNVQKQSWQMVQSMKVLDTQANDKSSIPRTLMVEGENRSCKLSPDLYVCMLAYTLNAYTHKINQ